MKTTSEEAFDILFYRNTHLEKEKLINNGF